MDINEYVSEKDEIYESNPTDVISSASLNINEEEWNQLICTDSDLAAQLGYYLLKRNKELEMLMETAESCAKEHQIRANHYEKQVQYMRSLFETQSKTYESFEKQVHDLTMSYQQMSGECRQYKERNKSLWEIVDNLERKCEDYLTELDLLKSNQACNIRKNTRKESVDVTDDLYSIPEDTNPLFTSADNAEELESDLVSLKAFSEEAARKLEIEHGQRLNYESKLDKSIAKIKDLENYIQLLEYRLKSQSSNNLLKCDSAEKLTKSQSMLSLVDSNAVEIGCQMKEEEANQGSDMDKRLSDIPLPEETNQNLSWRDLFQKLNNVGSPYSDDKQENIPSYTKMRNVLAGDNFCINCCSTPQTETLTTRFKLTSDKELERPQFCGKMDKTVDTAASNYRDIFAQIFEKLKVSRDRLNNN